jgi:hypothetical protein
MEVEGKKNSTVSSSSDTVIVTVIKQPNWAVCVSYHDRGELAQDADPGWVKRTRPFYL